MLGAVPCYRCTKRTIVANIVRFWKWKPAHVTPITSNHMCMHSHYPATQTYGELGGPSSISLCWPNRNITHAHTHSWLQVKLSWFSSALLWTIWPPSIIVRCVEIVHCYFNTLRRHLFLFLNLTQLFNPHFSERKLHTTRNCREDD